MNDYKELVDSLRICVKYKKAAEALCNAELAADAIEQLVKERDVLQLQNHLERCEHEHTRKERDAAVADLKEINLCYWCYNNNKHIVGKNKETQADVDIGECGQGGGLFHQLTLSGRRSWCEHFEWRGVQKEENDND